MFTKLPPEIHIQIFRQNSEKRDLLRNELISKPLRKALLATGAGTPWHEACILTFGAAEVRAHINALSIKQKLLARTTASSPIDAIAPPAQGTDFKTEYRSLRLKYPVPVYCPTTLQDWEAWYLYGGH